MKINKIHFQNINSLRGQHTIDFSQGALAEAGLFAITGPTGSGKSTLLDVICLALFNQIPRQSKPISKKMIEETGCILTRHTQEAFAEVTYTAAQGTYCAKWSISTARTGKLRDYDMQIAQANGQILDLKKSDIPKKNEALIGLSYTQFVKSILLAQGDFAKFLQAKKNERSELLEKITGTLIYRELGKMAFEKNKEFQNLINEKKQELVIYENEILPEEILLEKKEADAATKKAIKTLTGTIEKTKIQIRQQEAIESLQAKIIALEKQQTRQQAAWEEFQQGEGQQLSRHEALAEEAETLQLWQSALKERQQAEQEHLELNTKQGEVAKAQDQVLAEARRFTGQAVAAERVAEAVEAFAEEVAKLEDEKDGILAEFREQMALLEPLKNLGLSLSHRSLVADAQGYHQRCDQTQAKLNDLRQSLDGQQLNDAEAAISTLESQIIEAMQAQNTARLLADKQAEQQQAQAELAALDQRLEALPEEIAAQQAAYDLATKTRENLDLQRENQRLRASLQSHRDHLEAGQPCPLCGATEHPFASGLPVAPDDLAKQLKVAEKDERKAGDQLAALQNELKSVRKQQGQLQDALQQRKGQIGKLESQMAQHRQALGLAEEQLADWEKLQNQYRQTKARIADYQKVSSEEEILKAARKPLEAALQLLAAGKAKKAEIEARYPGKDVRKDAQQIRQQAERMEQKQEYLREQITKTEDTQKQLAEDLAQLESELLPPLRQRGYSDPAEALAARLSAARYHQLSQQRQRLQADLATTQTRLEEQQAQQKQLSEQAAELSLHALQTQLQQAETDLQTQNRTQLELHRQLQNHHENQQKATQLQTQIQALEHEGHRWALLNTYIGDATGKKFSEFAQDLTLSQLVQLANRRLAQLQDRYLLDRPTEAEDDGLIVIDQHMGSERRSVSTLSGGETFLLSLSLALALSDLASRHVEINSLFIDEGFGTLDPEVLDQTLDTLEKLQSEGGKTIGIISHVAALQERIHTQIRLIRHGQGHSKLEIVG